MVFDDLVEREQYDLVVGDEAWDVDYFLHENPGLKRSAYAWFTDFVGWLPMPDGGEEEAALTADYNAEMLDHRARHRGLRDRSIFVGNPDDIVPTAFGPDLPDIRTWTEANFDFAGYVTGFEPRGVRRPGRRPRPLGYRPDERVCLVTVGGSGVGGALLRRVLDAVPLARRLVPELRFRSSPDPGSTPRRCPRCRASSCSATGPTCTSSSPRATSPSCRAVSRLHGADGPRAPVPLRPAAAPLRAEPPRAPPARALRRRHPPRLRPCGRPGRAGHGAGPRSSAARWPTGRSRPTARSAPPRCSPACSDRA